MKRLLFTCLAAALVGVSGCSSPKAEAPVVPAWQWRNPLPGNPLLEGVATGDGLVVAVGRTGAVLTLDSQGHEGLSNTGMEADLNGVAFGGGQFVSIGTGGQVFTSVDGKGWTGRATPTKTDLTVIAYGGGRFVAVGDGEIIASVDGATWEKVATPALSGRRLALAFGAGRFVATTDAGEIVTSTDGHTWAPARSGTTDPITRVAFAIGRFVAAASSSGPTGPSTILLSTDGLTWESGTTLPPISVLAGGGERIVASAWVKDLGERIFVSTDGRTWEQAPIGLFRAFAYDGTQFWAAAHGGFLASSPDGLTWNQRLPAGSLTYMESVAFGGGRFVAVGNGGTAAVSTDGAAWEFPQASVGKEIHLWQMLWAKGQFWAVGHGGIFSSTDGATWTLRQKGSSRGPTQIAYEQKGGRLVAIDTVGVTFVSAEGSTWQQGNVADLDPQGSGSFQDVDCGAGSCVAIALSGARTESVLYSSVDGLSWTERATTSALESLTWANGRFVAVGPSGHVATSTDGVTWAQPASGIKERLFRVGFVGGQYVADGERHHFYSRDGKRWVAGPADSYGMIRFAEGNGMMVGVGGLGAILSAPVPVK